MVLSYIHNMGNIFLRYIGVHDVIIGGLVLLHVYFLASEHLHSIRSKQGCHHLCCEDIVRGGQLDLCCNSADAHHVHLCRRGNKGL